MQSEELIWQGECPDCYFLQCQQKLLRLIIYMSRFTVINQNAFLILNPFIHYLVHQQTVRSFGAALSKHPPDFVYKH